MKKLQIVLIILVTALLVSACGGNNTASNTNNSNNSDPANDSTNDENGSTDQGTLFSIDDITFDLDSEEANECANNLPLDFLNEDVINKAFTDGEAVTLLIQDSFLIEETLCAEETSQETLDILDEFDRLFEEGNTDQALQLIEEYSNELDSELDSNPFSMGGTPHLAAPALNHDGGATRRYVNDQLTIAARLQLRGLNEEAQYHIDMAKEAFEKYGNEELELLEDDFIAALSLAAEAQLLGIPQLSENALDKAIEILERLLPLALDSFEPCISTQADVNYLDTLFLYGLGIGVNYAENNVNEYILDLRKQWEEIQRKRNNGQEAPECILVWEIEIDMTITEGTTTMVFHWEGLFQVDENQNIEGSLAGTLKGDAPELPCLYFEGNKPIEAFNPTTYKGTARTPITGILESEGDNVVFQLNHPQNFDAAKMSTIRATYGNKKCGGKVYLDFMAQFFRIVMAIPITFIGPGAQGHDYLELPAKTQVIVLSAPIEGIPAEYTITIKDPSDY